jgi:hypothetical protein
MGTIIHFVGEDNLTEFLKSSNAFQPLFAILIGLIPNCASSVILTELYLMGGLSFGSIIAGLCVNAGIGIMVLFKQNKNLKENFFIVSMLFVSSLAIGYALHFIPFGFLLIKTPTFLGVFIYVINKFYMLASFIGEGYHRGTAIFECDTPDGKFKPHSNGAVTPRDWECLDGTLYIEDGTPYIVFCHEWEQINDGTVCALQLSSDLKSSVGEPIFLWRASDAKWKYDIRDGEGCFVTDGPFLIKKDNELLSIWSSFYKGEYCEAIARSSNGKISGKWTIDDTLIYEKDGGHGMIFEDNGKSYFVFHTPNDTPNERPSLKEIDINKLFENK